MVVGVGSGAGSWLPGLSREATDPPPSREWWNTVCGLSICLLFCCLLAHCPSLSSHLLLQEQEPSTTSIFIFRYILHISCLLASFRAFLLHFILSKVLTFGVSVLRIPQNWVLLAEYHMFTEISHGTLTAVLLHRRRRTQITAPHLCILAISV